MQFYILQETNEEITNAEENPKEVKDEAVQEKEEVVLTEEEIEKLKKHKTNLSR